MYRKVAKISSALSELVPLSAERCLMEHRFKNASRLPSGNKLDQRSREVVKIRGIGGRSNLALQN